MYIIYDVVATTIFTSTNMADISENVVKMARFLAIAHIIVGFLLIIFGIADGVTSFLYSNFWTGHIFFGIWIGVWVSCLCGLIPEYSTSCTAVLQKENKTNKTKPRLKGYEVKASEIFTLTLD